MMCKMNIHLKYKPKYIQNSKSKINSEIFNKIYNLTLYLNINTNSNIIVFIVSLIDLVYY